MSNNLSDPITIIISNISFIAFTIVGIWAIIKYVKMNEKVKDSIIKKNERTNKNEYKGL